MLLVSGAGANEAKKLPPFFWPSHFFVVCFAHPTDQEHWTGHKKLSWSIYATWEDRNYPHLMRKYYNDHDGGNIHHSIFTFKKKPFGGECRTFLYRHKQNPTLAETFWVFKPFKCKNCPSYWENSGVLISWTLSETIWFISSAFFRAVTWEFWFLCKTKHTTFYHARNSPISIF